MWTSRLGSIVLRYTVRITTSPAVSLRQSFSQSSSKNTAIVERWWQVPLAKEGSPPRLHPRRHRVYKLVEDTKHAPKEKMELILTQTVSKLGGRGDTVFVKKSLGRNKLLPQGLAVYPSPENKEMFAEERRILREGKKEDRIQTRTGQLTVDFLKCAHLEVEMHTSFQYEITKEIVCRQFLRKLGVVVPMHALTLPEEPVTGLGDYWCDVTVNGLDTVKIPVSVVPFKHPRLQGKHKDLHKQQQEETMSLEQEEGVSVPEEEQLKSDNT
ncbi:large ribosomal subunit protein bL9m [Chanos chanos]|uniref:Large ribosomal subunit protein bL9m n=1 Tax=Chanos chanos TaxID=29144 RepID=A0A6J2UN81_CHACN|nr:39S ribosomal protein L9, mitochondrial [Chanos chanos]